MLAAMVRSLSVITGVAAGEPEAEVDDLAHGETPAGRGNALSSGVTRNSRKAATAVRSRLDIPSPLRILQSILRSATTSV